MIEIWYWEEGKEEVDVFETFMKYTSVQIVVFHGMERRR